MKRLALISLLFVWAGTAVAKEWTVTLDSPEEEGDMLVSTQINNLFSGVCFKVDHIVVVTNKSTPVEVYIAGGQFGDRFTYRTVVTTDVHPEFGRAEVPIKGTPADKYIKKLNQLVAIVMTKGRYSVRMRVTVKFYPSVKKCDDYGEYVRELERLRKLKRK